MIDQAIQWHLLLRMSLVKKIPIIEIKEVWD